MQKFLAFVYAVILLTVSQSPSYGQSFTYSRIQDNTTGDTAGVTPDGALDVNILSSSGTTNVNLTNVGGTTTPTGNGTAGAGGVLRVTLASDSIGHVIFWDGTNTAAVSVAGALKVDGSAVTQPVSVASPVAVTGTFWQATQPVSGTFFQATQPVSVAATVSVDASGHTVPVSQSGTWNIGTVATIINPVAVTGSFWQATQPISAASLPLPTGASTSAKQPALGTAGTASTDVISVQGIASMTPLKVDGSGVTQPVSGTFWQATQPVSGSFFQATQPVSAVSLPLPTGASTAAKQPALGTAGSASADVISVQGIASMTAFKVDGSAVTQPVSAASLPLPSGAATSAKQPALGTAGTASTDVLTVQGKSGMTALVVDGSAVIQPVSAASLPLPSGAATAAKQPALGTAGTASSDVVSVQGIASMTALKVDGSAVTQPVSAASLPLPTGASTAAKQPALGIAGTASADVLTVQGKTGMTALVVDGSGVTQPVSAASLPLPTGASTSAKQPALGIAGTASADVLTVQGKTGMTALVVDPSGVTSPVSAASLPLPTGAATSAKQPALGTAGTASADVLTVQGKTSMTPLLVDPSGVTSPVSIAGTVTTNDSTANLSQGSTTSGEKGQLMQGAVTTAAPSYTTAQTSPLSLDTAGNLRVNVVTGGTSGTVAQGSTTSGQSGNLIQGAVGTSPPSYTNAQTSPLSLNTAGDLRVDQTNLGVSFQNNTGINSNGSVLTIIKQSAVSCRIYVNGTFSATVNFELSLDGVNWSALSCVREDSGSVVTSTTTPGNFLANISGIFQLRGRVSGYVSGAVNAGVTTFNVPVSPGLASKILDASGTNVAVVSAGGALKIDGSAVTQPVSDANLGLAQNSTTSGQLGPLMQGAVTFSDPSYTTAKTAPLSMNTIGYLRTLTGIGSATGITGVSFSGGRSNMQSAAAANGNGIADSGLQGVTSAVIHITGTFSATVNFELSQDLGVTWNPVLATSVGAATTATTATTAGDWLVSLSGATNLTELRARISGYVSGSVSVSDSTSAFSGAPQALAITNFPATQPVSGTVTANAGTGTMGVNLAQIGGSTQSAANPMPAQLSQGGTVLSQTNGAPVMPVLSTKATFMACSNVMAVPATPTDMVAFGGSASKTVKILRIKMYASQTTSALDQFFLNKHSSANTGGTPVSDTAVPLDSADTATATLVHYTANPTPGTSIGALTQPKIEVSAATTGENPGIILFDASAFGKPIVLTGVAQQVALNFAGVALPAGLQVQLEILWTEE